MVSAIVLMDCERGKVKHAAEAVAAIPGVTEVYSVAGRADLVAIVRVSTNEELADIVTERIPKTGGVARTETMFAFQVFSPHDLEALFSIGAEG